MELTHKIGLRIGLLLLISDLQFIVQILLSFIASIKTTWYHIIQQNCSNCQCSGEDIISNAEIKMAMGKLGIMECDPDGDISKLTQMFEEQEPSFEELSEAFDVFDENRDGFIDERELQRVLMCLGLGKEVIQLEGCKRMISLYDENGDGVIDLYEFVKLMIKCLC